MLIYYLDVTYKHENHLLDAFLDIVKILVIKYSLKQPKKNKSHENKQKKPTSLSIASEKE